MSAKPIAFSEESKKAILDYLVKWGKSVEDAIIYNLSYAGDKCLAAARTSSGYTDQTGNLRSSIGFRLLKDGKLIKESSFEVVKKGDEGAKEGLAKVEKIAANFPRGIVLVFVAGMDYAGYVADTGRDVLDSAALLADKLVPKLLEDVRKKINGQ